MAARPPKWERGEIVEVLQLGHRLGWPKTLSPDHAEIKRLSLVLRERRGIPIGDQVTKDRNGAGVARKYSDIYSLLPTNSTKPTNGGRLTQAIVNEYLEHGVEAFES